MKSRAALLCAALAAAPAPAQPAAGEARAVIAAVLAHQASVRGPEGAAQTCVVAALAAPPAADGDDPMMPDHAVRIGFQWHAPEPPARVRPVRERTGSGDPRTERRRERERERMEPIPLPPALPQALADQLNALRMAAAPAPTSALRAIDPALVPAPLRLFGPGGDCAPLTLSAPVFAAEAAFVETAYACGTVCGNGSFYALRRRDGRWEVVGIADIWIR
jgi:hypothetical protein